jgi:hypothetical protein
MPKTGKPVNDKHTSNSGKVGWELMLERAKSSLYRNKLERSRLTRAIRLFQEKITNGDPWPVEQEASSKQDGSKD